MSTAKGQLKKERLRRGQLLRTAQSVKASQGASRSLLRNLLRLEALLDSDFYGQVTWEPSESRDHVMGVVGDLLMLAREDYPDQKIEVDVVVHIPGGNGVARPEARTRREA